MEEATELESVLEEAKRITSGRRRKDYGSALDNWTRTAKLWSPVLGIEVTADQAILCMVLVKVARESYCRNRDNRVDIAGYAEILDQIQPKQ